MMTVAELLRAVRRPKLEGIEGVASRIAAGNPPPAEEIAAVLDATRCSDDDLQAAVDRHLRVAELRKRIADAAPAAKRFSSLDAELKAADVAVANAVHERDAVIARVGADHATCKAQADVVVRATDELLRDENLSPADVDRRSAAEAEAKATSERATQAAAEADTCRRSLREAEDNLPLAEAEVRVNAGNADIAARAERYRNAVKARGERLRAAEAARRDADEAAAEADRKLAGIHAAIRKAVLG